MVGPPDETDPSGESLIRIVLCPSLIKNYGYVLYLLLISICTIRNKWTTTLIRKHH